MESISEDGQIYVLECAGYMNELLRLNVKNQPGISEYPLTIWCPFISADLDTFACFSPDVFSKELF